MDSGDTRHAETIPDSFKFKRLKRIKSKEPLKDAEEKI